MMRRDLRNPVSQTIQAGKTTGQFIMAAAAVYLLAGCANPSGHPSQNITKGGSSKPQAPMCRVLPAELASRAEEWGLSKAVIDKVGQKMQGGADIQLTLDKNIQQYVEQALEAAMTNFHPQAAWAIVEEVRTGAILAMASLPNSEPNRATGMVFEPGSIFTVGVVAAALNEGRIATNDLFDCENGSWTYGGKPVKDFHPYGILDVTGILRKSSNIGAAKIAVQLGPKDLQNYLKSFGFGRTTGLEVTDEESGALNPPSKWSKVSLVRLAMGHEVAVTALQMLNVLCCIGNDGLLMKPHLVRQVVNKDGVILLKTKPEALGQPITARTAELMRLMLTEVTREGGTGTRAAVPGYNVAGKTGTAEKIVDGHYLESENIASFMGLLPAERPEIGIIVVLDNPRPLRTGSISAAPVFAQIAAAVAGHLGIHNARTTDSRPLGNRKYCFFDEDRRFPTGLLYCTCWNAGWYKTTFIEEVANGASEM